MSQRDRVRSLYVWISTRVQTENINCHVK